MAVVFSARSRRDLEAIGDHIAEDSLLQADLQVTRLENFCATLATNSLRYPVMRQLGSAPLRRGVVGPYSIFYQVEEQNVFIVAILHSARDHERILFPED